MPIPLEAVVSLNRGNFDSTLGSMGALVRNTAGAMAYAFGGVGAEVATLTRAFGPLGAVVGILKPAIAIGSEFEQQMANVASVTGLAGAQLQSVGEAARDFAADTAFTATEAAQALYGLGSAGFSAAGDLEDLLAPALKLAGATAADAGRTTEAMTSTIAAFRLEASAAGKVADLFAGAVAASPATMNRLAAALSQANPVAAAFGMSVEQTVESLASFHKVGIMGSRAGTAFRQAMTRLVQEMNKADSVLSPALAGWRPQVEGLTGAIRRLEQHGITGAQAMAVLGIKGGQAVAAQLALGSDAISKLGNRIRETGDVSAMYAQQMNTVNNQWKIFISKMQESGLRIFDAIRDEVILVIQGLQSGVAWVQKFWEAVGKGTAIEFSLESLKKLGAIVKTIGAGLIADLKSMFARVNTWLQNVDWQKLGITIGLGFMNAIKTGINMLATFHEKIGAGLASVVGEILGTIVRQFMVFFSGLNAGILAQEGGITEAVVKLLIGVGKTFRSFLDGLLSGLFGDRRYMEYITNGIYLWFLQIKAAVIKFGAMVIAQAKNFATSFAQTISEALADLAGLVGFTNMEQAYRTQVQGLAEEIQNTLDKSREAGLHVEREIAGAMQALGNISQTAANEAQTALEGVGAGAEAAGAKANSIFAKTAKALEGLGLTGSAASERLKRELAKAAAAGQTTANAAGLIESGMASAANAAGKLGTELGDKALASFVGLSDEIKGWSDVGTGLIWKVQGAMKDLAGTMADIAWPTVDAGTIRAMEAFSKMADLAVQLSRFSTPDIWRIRGNLEELMGTNFGAKDIQAIRKAVEGAKGWLYV